LSKFLDEDGASIAYAIPNHPWIDDATAAAVRVAFSVGHMRGEKGVLEVVSSEVRNSRTELPTVETREFHGIIRPDLTIGIDVTKLRSLKANQKMSFQGLQARE
jgi:hypothetical protein